MPALQTPDEWYKCMARGCEIVKYHADQPTHHRPGIPLITVFHIPSFVDATGWTVRRLPRNQGYELQKVVWQQQHDLSRMENLMTGRSVCESSEPTISTATIVLNDKEWETLFSVLTTVQIPILAEHPMGLDGESFGIWLPGRLKAEWWGEGPADWHMLTKWTRSAISYFNSQSPQEAPWSLLT